MIWVGDVAPHPDLIVGCGNWGQVFRTKSSTAARNPAFWASVLPNTYLKNFLRPLALHQRDRVVVEPAPWSETLAEAFEPVDHQPSALHPVPGDSGSIGTRLGVAGQRTAALFDEFVGGESE